MRLVAQKIEAECYNMFEKVVDKDYRTKLRDLVFNLKDKRNGQLRARLLKKELSPEKVWFLKKIEEKTFFFFFFFFFFLFSFS